MLQLFIFRFAMFKKIALLFLFLLLFGSIFGQAAGMVEHPRISALTTRHGLPQNTVDCILKDSKGFMWFGTWNGLCRFDAYNFNVFQKQQEALLPGNMIQALCEDADGNIWVGTEAGLALFNYNRFRFVAADDLLGGCSVTDIKNGRSGKLWCATEGNGLWCVERNDENQWVASPCFEHELPSQNINCLLTDEHVLLVGTDAGLKILPLDNEQPALQWKQMQDQLPSVGIQTIFKDTEGNFWLGASNAGLYYWQVNAQTFHYFGTSADDETGLSHLAVSAIAESRNGTIIVGTLGGLNFFDRQNHTFSHLPEGRLSSPFVNSLLADSCGNIWIGSEKGGVNFYNSYQKPFNAMQHRPGVENSISHNTINSLFIEDTVLWIGTAGGGLNKVEGDKITRFRHEPGNAGSINSDFVSSVYRDKHGHLWVGTWGGGLNRLVSEERNDFEILINLPSDSASLYNSFVSCIEPLDDDKLLVGTARGLDIFNTKTKTFLHVHESMKLKKALPVGCLLSGQNKRVWVGTEKGLFRFDKDDLTRFSGNTEAIPYRKYLNRQDDSSSLAGDYVISLFEADDGTIWIGTYGNGICQFVEDGEEGKFVNYTEKHGLCNNVAYGIEEDRQGNLWISTDNGLAQFDTEKKTFKNYSESDGLPNNQFYWSASCADEKGRLYFGSIAGLSYFSPEQIKSYSDTPRPVFTAFSIFSKPVIIGKEYHSQVVLKEPVSLAGQINLSYKDAVFSIEFSALDYFLPEKIKYAYQMEGVDRDWVQVPASRRFANYTNLAGGEYVFKVKASNSDGVWNEVPTVLTINIKPPFWKTFGFRVLAALLIMALVLAYIRYRTRFLKKQKRKLEQQVRERTHKIEAQKEELEKQRDEVIELNEKVKLVNQFRLRFFTNISHEFRTPLTLIIDPLEQLMQKLKSDKNTHNTLNIINRNAQRLLHLINQVLYFRRVETGKLQLNVGQGNLAAFLSGIFESFKDLATHQQIDYQFSTNEAEAETWFDAEKVENVFYNILSNAFKYTPVSGSIRMQVKFVHEGRDNGMAPPYVAVSVRDSGMGISREHLPHIFDRFYKAGKATDFSSSGIGLALTYELVKALHGEISVESEQGRGSLFTVCMPYTKARFLEEEINPLAVSPEINIEGRINVLSDHVIARESGYENEDETAIHKARPTVLVVEDNFDLRSFLLQTLRADYRMIGAENGKIGLEMAKKYSPELIISDVMMPEMDGIELCRHLKQNIQTSHIPIILLTAKDMLENWIEGLETGADDYIPKPFNLQILQAKIRNFIDSRRKIKRLFSTPEGTLPDKLSANKLDEAFIAKAYEILEKNYNEADFSVEQFANDMFVSQSLLYKKLKALTGLGITDFVNSYKLKKAVVLIKTTQQPIAEIAFATGFNDPKYFSRIFKKFYGLSPRDFKAENA